MGGFKDYLSLCFCLFFLSLATAKPYVSWGWHGGYYLTDEEGTQAAFDTLFKYLSANPNLKAVLELEPYTIERMLLGEQFPLEKRGREERRIRNWGYGGSGEWDFLFGKEYAHRGSVGVRLTFEKGEYAQIIQAKPALNLQGKTLIFSGWIRAHKGEGAYLYIDAWDSNNFIPGSARFSQRVPPEGDWHYVELEFPVPQNAATIFPQAKIDSQPGYADFDDLSLKIKETGEELLLNGDLEDVFVPSLKDEARLKELKGLVKRGQIEIVGGAYTQPIMFTIGEEAVVRQFLLGCRAVEETLGIPVKVYAAQEPDMIGQLPQILEKFGFHAILYRTSWGAFGFVPSFDAEVVNWIGPDGTSFVAIPQPQPLRNGWGAPAGPSSDLVKECRQRGIEDPLFIAFGDFVASWVDSSAPAFLIGRFESGYANLCQRLPAENLRGKRLELSAWVRARKGSVHLYIDAHNAQGVAKGGTQTADCPLDDKWHLLKLNFRVPDDAVFIFPQGRIISFAEGDADFASLRLQDEEGKELLSLGPLPADSLPPEWDIGKSEGVKVNAEVVRGETKEGERFVRLTMKLPPTPYETKVVTIEEYLKEVGSPQVDWADAYKGFEHRFPFGLLGGRPQRADRMAEEAILKTERFLALAYGEQNERFPKELAEKLDDAWRLLLIGQHHDAWVCAPVVGGIWSKGFKSFAELTYEASREVREICQSLINPFRKDDWRRFNLLNLGGEEWEGITTLQLSLPQGLVKNPLFESGGKGLPANIEVLSRHPDGSVRELKAQILAQLPPMGYISVHLREGSSPRIEKMARASGEGERAVLENDFLRVVIAKDGLLMAYSPSGEPLLRQPAYLIGHFASGDQIGGIEEVKAYNEGSLAIGEARGRIGDVPFALRLTLSPFSPLVNLNIGFSFGEKSVIGTAGEFPPLPDVPDWARDDLKLRLVLPLNFEKPRFYSQGAFELREPYERFVPILRYGGAEGEGSAVAIYTDRATSGIFDGGEKTLSLVLAYGGNFIYAPAEFAPLSGEESYQIALYFYKGEKESARVAKYGEEIAQPIIALPVTGNLKEDVFSLLRINPQDAVELSALYPVEDGFILRLWRPYEGERKISISFAAGKEIWLADMGGNPQKKIGDNGKASFSLKQNEVITLLIKR